jgi:hypothetical protein
MTDYLMRLAGRVSAAPPILQPAIPSLYAPRKSAVGAELEDVFKETERRSTKLRQNSDPTISAQTVHQGIAGFESLSPAATTPTTKFKEGSSPQVLPALGVSRVQNTGEPVVDHKRVAELNRPAEFRSPAEPVPSGHEMERVPAENPDPSASPAAIRPRMEDSQQASTPVAFQRPATALGTIQPSMEARQPESSSVKRAAYPEPMLSSGIAPRRYPRVGKGEQRPRDSLFSPSPEIRVTIGRIEIRAITTPAPAQRQPPLRVPKLSLDDYLRLRNGGAA